MSFEYSMPTEIFFGENCVSGHADRLAAGRRAYIVCGAGSARKSGALQDVTEALAQKGVEYKVFEGIGNNPDVEQCRSVGADAREWGADFVVGIGGGSPMDAAKAVAVFAAGDVDLPTLYSNAFADILPIVAVPTTSGTGSEVTPWSIVTDHAAKTKNSFGCRRTLPKAAFLDPQYTRSLPYNATLSTAFDAFTHCFESFISLKASPVTDAMNREGMARFAAVMDRLIAGDHESIRGELMTVSLLGGMTIAVTSTTIQHAMGYPLTYFYGVSHGAANGQICPIYLEELAALRPERLEAALAASGLTVGKLTDFVKKAFPIDYSPADSELRLWGEQTASRKNVPTSGLGAGPDYFYGMYSRLFGGAR